MSAPTVTYTRALKLAEQCRGDTATTTPAALTAAGYPAKLAGQARVYTALTAPGPGSLVPAVVIDYMGQRSGSVRLVIPETGPPQVQVDHPAPAAERAAHDLLAHLTGGTPA